MRLQPHQADLVVVGVLYGSSILCTAIALNSHNLWWCVPLLAQGLAAGYLHRNSRLIREGKIVFVDPEMQKSVEFWNYLQSRPNADTLERIVGWDFEKNRPRDGN